MAYPIFKGLQKPLEFMGIRGRFLIMIAAGFACSFLGFIVFSIVGDKLWGFLAMVLIAGLSYGYVFVKQKQGLHNKQRHRGVYVYHNIYIK